MQVMTFEEWREANQDLENELREETHPSGDTFGLLADIGTEGAAGYISGSMRRVYEQQLKQDQENLAAWNRAVASIGDGSCLC